MAISKSSNRRQKWLGGVHLFSGRPDPCWAVSAAAARRLQGIWSTLEPWTGGALPVPQLGYRGFFLRGPDVEWHAYVGMVIRKAGDRSEMRRDKERAFEKALLASAPKGVLSASLTEYLMRLPERKRDKV
jgi:hypothetical protein